MVSRRELSKAERRAAILCAASALIERHGLAGATMRRIAEDAEVSPATVYNLIGSSDDVFDALFDGLVSGLELGQSGEVVNPLTDLIATAGSAVEFLIDRAVLFGPLMADRSVRVALRDGPRLEWARRRCARLIAAAVEAGSVDDRADPDLLGRLLVDGFISNYVRWAIGELDDAGFGRRVRLDTVQLLGVVVTEAGRRLLDRLVEDAA